MLKCGWSACHCTTGRSPKPRFRHQRGVAYRSTLIADLLTQRRQITERLDAGEEKIRTSLDRGEGRHTRYLLADRPLRHREIECAVLVADERVSFVAQLVKIPIIDPDILRKLKLPHEACTENE